LAVLKFDFGFKTIDLWGIILDLPFIGDTDRYVLAEIMLDLSMNSRWLLSNVFIKSLLFIVLC
jgi:hypothetical protein